MFIAALFVRAKTWKQYKSPSTVEWLNKELHVHTIEYYSAVHKTTRTNLKIINLDKRSVIKMNMPFMTPLKWNSKRYILGTSLVAQWLRIRLTRQGIRVRALVREDPTCRRATKPVHHSYWACALEPVSHNYRAHVPQLLKPTHLEPMLCNKRSHHNEKPAHCNKELPLLSATRESLCTATKTQCSQK